LVRKTTTKKAADALMWGSVAVGSAGRFTVEVDESLSGPSVWQVSVDSPAVFFSLRLGDLGSLFGIRHALDKRNEKPDAGFQLSNDPFRLDFRWDNPAGGRCTVHLSAPAHDVRFTLGDDELKHIGAALDDVIQQLRIVETWTAQRG
jgi:hypothetical protein